MPRNQPNLAMTTARTLTLSLSLCMLPLSLWFSVTLLLFVAIRPWIPSIRWWKSTAIAIRSKRILLTGNDDQVLLTTARLLHASGHAVYVVGYEPLPLSSILRYSKAVKIYVGLSSRRVSSIMRTMKERVSYLAASFNIRVSSQLPVSFPGTVICTVDAAKIDLWIPCDSAKPSLSSTQTRDVVMKHSACRIFGPDTETAKIASSYQNFTRFVKRMEGDVRTPRSSLVRSRTEIHHALGDAPKGQKFLLERSVKPQTVTTKAKNGVRRHSAHVVHVSTNSDSDDFDGAQTSTPVQEFMVLPHTTVNDTYNSVATTMISKDSPWVLHELVEGKPGTVSVLVVRGKVAAFVTRTAVQERTFSTAGKSSSLSGVGKVHVEHDVKEWQHHEVTTFLDPASTVGQALLQYTQKFVAALPGSQSTHLNLHFFLADRTVAGGAQQRIVATGCDFNFTPIFTQVALTSENSAKLAKAYVGVDSIDTDIALLPVMDNGAGRQKHEWYSMPSVIVRKSMVTTFRMLQSRSSSYDICKGVAASSDSLADGPEVLFDSHDMVPWIWFWSQWPLRRLSRGGLDRTDK